MNKKMRELLNSIEEKRNQAKAFRDEKNISAAQEKITEMEELQKEYEVEKALFEAERELVPDEGNKGSGETNKKANGFQIVAKMLRGQHLGDTEKALITGDDAAYGENNLIPEDVRLAINELRKSYVSAKDLVDVVTTTSLTGSFNYEDGTPAGLTAFDDGDSLGDETGMKFIKKAFAIAWYGKLIPISNILKGAEQAGLMGYINTWFLKNAILTENTQIFTTLAANKTAVALKGIATLRASIIKDLDPSVLIDAVIVTNQTGFAAMDGETDAIGRPMLQKDPENPNVKMLCGLPIKVFADAQLANVSGSAPIFYGSTKAGAKFIEHESLNFATSEHYGFGKNQTTLRVLEGFDVVQADTSAYIYGTFTAADPKVVLTESTDEEADA